MHPQIGTLAGNHVQLSQCFSATESYNPRSRQRLEGAASGYWPPPAKRSSGSATRVQVPRPPFATRLDLKVLDNVANGVILELLRRRCSVPNFKPRSLGRGLSFWAPCCSPDVPSLSRTLLELQRGDVRNLSHELSRVPWVSATAPAQMSSRAKQGDSHANPPAKSRDPCSLACRSGVARNSLHGAGERMPRLAG